MASNRELAARARELGRERGVDVDTSGLDKAGLTALLEQLEAGQPRDSSSDPGKPQTAAEAQLPQPDADTQPRERAVDPGELPVVEEPAQLEPGAHAALLASDDDASQPEALDDDDDDDDVEPETWRPRALRRRLIVAPNKAVLCSRGVHLHEGDEVRPGDFDEPTLRQLIAKGAISDESP